ncbi:MAG: small ribosomal subunit Rsm22 family protein [Bdellovibrionia bacterium]
MPEKLAFGFGKEFEDFITRFSLEQGLIPDASSLSSTRYLNRCILPHVQKLSQLFNRNSLDPKHEPKNQRSPLNAYWKETSNPEHLRAAYFLSFMPANLYRVASIWAELRRLGFQWSTDSVRAIELGAGPASGACGIMAGEKFAPVGLPSSLSWALVEQDKNMLQLGASWLEAYTSYLGGPHSQSSIRTFHRKIDLKQGFLPRGAPQFHLWIMSYFLNESEFSPRELAAQLITAWQHHLEDEGVVILVEPALKLQSRQLLELRAEILLEAQRRKLDWLKLLLPCLGHQNCGALASPEDWCHEEVTWWRPPYFKAIDQKAGLDRKTLPFSYLVFIKTQRSRTEVLPALASPELNPVRLVSPAYSQGQDLEFFLCGAEGKRRARVHQKKLQASTAEKDPALQKSSEGETPEPQATRKKEALLQRGDILLDTEIRGDQNASRIESLLRII